MHRKVGEPTVKVIEAVDYAQKLEDHQKCGEYSIFSHNVLA